MTVHIHKLEGCAPTPLAHYLKALAILRLVAEQADPGARGWWKDEAFSLATSLSRDELLRFFLDEYKPTPVLSPWNGGSGFFYDSDVGLTPIEHSTAARLGPFRQGIASARAMSAPLAAAIAHHKAAEDAAKRARRDETLKLAVAAAKAERDVQKAMLLPACRRLWVDGLLEWFDAALVIDSDGDAAWPALLGSGGNDGRLDFTNNAMQHISSLFDCSSPAGSPTALARALLPSTLFGAAVPGLHPSAAGQFSPGNAGGDNMGSGFEGDSLVNPWDFVLMLEGCIVFASSVARRTDSGELPQASAPFAVRSTAAGYLSAAIGDDVPRGEQWMPIWTQPSRFGEVQELFGEGRVRIGRETATRAVEVPRALARLGVARGVSSFQRYGYIERNGQANLAVPLGRWTVSAQPREALVDEVASWAGRLRGVARDERTPKSIASAARLVDESIFAVCRAGADPLGWQTLLIALGNGEAALLRTPRTASDPKKGLAPLTPLSGAWIDAANDGSAEFRLAIALASQDAVFRSKDGEVVASVRGHWMPIDHSHPSRRPARFATGASGLAADPDVVCAGRDLERDCIALVMRRVQMAPALKTRGLGLVGANCCRASLADVMAFLDGTVDDARVLSLARPLMAVKWWEQRSSIEHPSPASPDAAYAILRIAHLSGPLRREGGDVCVQLDPEPVARLSAGDVAGAVAVCLRRLRSSGLTPTVRIVAGDAARARRLAASLAFPIRAADSSRCADLVTKPYLTDLA